jgi:hypothetical protein
VVDLSHITRRDAAAPEAGYLTVLSAAGEAKFWRVGEFFCSESQILKFGSDV